ncbi:MAG: antitoxin VapB family protein [Nanoarchaeota archaeon]
MVKMVSLSNEAYSKLKALKGLKSFSEVIVELVNTRKKKKSIMDFAGAFKDNSDEWKEIEEKIYSDRKNFKLRGHNL